MSIKINNLHSTNNKTAHPNIRKQNRSGIVTALECGKKFDHRKRSEIHSMKISSEMAAVDLMVRISYRIEIRPNVYCVHCVASGFIHYGC